MLEGNAAAAQNLACATSVCGPRRKVCGIALWLNLAAGTPFANFAHTARAHLRSCTLAPACKEWVHASNGGRQVMTWPESVHFGPADG